MGFRFGGGKNQSREQQDRSHTNRKSLHYLFPPECPPHSADFPANGLIRREAKGYRTKSGFDSASVTSRLDMHLKDRWSL
jgi:hypothetical protein